MAYLVWAEKDPNDVEDRYLDWTERLSEAGDTVASAAWTITPTGDADDLDIDSQSETTALTTVWLSKGRAGVTYLLTCRMTTAGGRVIDQTVKLKVKEH